MNRRTFIDYSAQWSLMTLMHPPLATPEAIVNAKNEARSPLIKSLELLTKASLDSMKTFYVDTIGFTLIEQSKIKLIFQGGLTRFTFIKSETTLTRPFYHFAFNIPENKIQSAFEWQRKLTPIIHPNPSGPINEITHFPHWDAHSVFFLDPAGNLVEYIARHALNNSNKGAFSVADILYTSEIGFIVNDVKTTGEVMLEHLKLKEYRSLANNFWPIGDEYGLLLLIEKGKEWRANPGERNITDLFKIKVGISESLNLPWHINDYPYDLFNAD